MIRPFKYGLVLCLLWIGVAFIIVPPISAQPQSIERLAVQGSGGQFTFYNVNAAGNFQLLDTLTNEVFAITTPRGEWSILFASDFVVSPNGRYVAFVAHDELENAALFLYTLGEPGLRRIDLSGMSAIRWSPGKRCNYP